MIDSQESDSSTLDRAVLETRVLLRRLRRRRRRWVTDCRIPSKLEAGVRNNECAICHALSTL